MVELTSSATEPGAMDSALGPGASVGGAGGLNNDGPGADACFFLGFFLLGVGAGTSAVGVATGELVGGATGTGDGGDFAGGELTGAGAGGELTGATAGGGVAIGVATGVGTVCFGEDATGVAAGGDDTGAGVGAANGTEGVVGVAGVDVGDAAGAWPPTPATMTQISAKPSMPFRSILREREGRESAKIEKECFCRNIAMEGMMLYIESPVVKRNGHYEVDLNR
ncbi:hypothetical protein OIU84_029836 [Salix udensis]|uniref:Uncharacterized protein n=1 Tax=Salix udensis TaxID=889485 RepID=A0AAD6KAP9_9ROSI|nr:hypothetical protein OIU84_029836 [Salix udensis]